MEYGCKVAGSKVVVVMGHTKCGAVNAACSHVELGNITGLLDKIQPAVSAIYSSRKISKKEKMSDSLVEEVAIHNVKLSIDRIRVESEILSDLEKEGAIEIIGALYDVSNGKVKFL